MKILDQNGSATPVIPRFVHGSSTHMKIEPLKAIFMSAGFDASELVFELYKLKEDEFGE